MKKTVSFVCFLSLIVYRPAMVPTFLWLLFFCVTGALQAAYWIALHRGFARARRQAQPEAPTSVLPPLSVVVAARDEAKNLPSLLAALTSQTHPCYEILLVNDASTDVTGDIARAWQTTHTNLRVLSVKQPQAPRKKHALTQGIDAAAYPLLALTDADCTPPPGWLATLAQHHGAAPEDTLFVGYSPFRKAPGILNRLARYETFVTGFLTAAAIGLDRPYMAVGRNFSYPRAVFRRIDGFAHSLHALSGDDDLFVQEVTRRQAASIRHLFDPTTFVPSAAPTTWREWIRQKRRHLSAGRFYDRNTQIHLALFHATGILLWAAPLLVGWPGLILLLAKLGVQGLVLSHAARVLHETDLLPAQPLLELLYTVYNLVLAPLGLSRLPKRW